jgi:hypothetical protein
VISLKTDVNNNFEQLLLLLIANITQIQIFSAFVLSKSRHSSARLDGVRDFSTLHSTQTSSGAQPVSYPMVQGALSLGAKWLGLEADHWPPSSAEVKNDKAMQLHSPTHLHGMALHYLSRGSTLPLFCSQHIIFLLRVTPSKEHTKKPPWPLVRERTIPTKLLVGEVSANFCW